MTTPRRFRITPSRNTPQDSLLNSTQTPPKFIQRKSSDTFVQRGRAKSLRQHSLAIANAMAWRTQVSPSRLYSTWLDNLTLPQKRRTLLARAQARDVIVAAKMIVLESGSTRTSCQGGTSAERNCPRPKIDFNTKNGLKTSTKDPPPKKQ